MSMKKGHSLIGLTIINQLGGSHLGKVLDLVFDHDADECVALVVKEKDLFGLIAAQVILWEEIRTIGPDAVMVESAHSLVSANDIPRVRSLMERQHSLSGTRIYTTDGRFLGTFGDVYLDTATGKVLGYEVSGGLMSDTMSGKRYLPAEVGPDIGKDAVIVSTETADLLSQQEQEEPGGVVGAMKTAGEKISESYEGIANASVEKQQAFVVGKTAAYDVVIPRQQAADTAATTALPVATSETVVAEGDVLTNEVMPAGTTSVESSVTSDGEIADGEVLVRKGETITQEHAMRASQVGVLGKLVAAAIGGAASEKYGAASGQAGEYGSGMQAKAEEAAIGKPAGREVDLADGSILVAPGQIITPAIIDIARRHGKEKEVVAAAGLGAASESVQSGAAAVKEGAGSLWDSIKEKAAELTGAAHQKKAEMDDTAMQRRINDAVGRPTTRVILAPDDSIILNTGDIITHAAVNHAREAGVLEILLDSVFTADPEITPEMLRVLGKGEDALDEQQDPDGKPITATVSPEARSQDTPSQGGLSSGGITANP